MNKRNEIIENLNAAGRPLARALRSVWVQGFGIYALMIVIGIGRQDAAPITESAGKAELQEEQKRVRIISRREGENTRFLVENHEQAEVTVTFNFDLTNLKSSKDLPLTATFPAQQTTEAFVLTPADSDEAWQYSYTNYHNLGSCEAVHEDSVCYSLPYAPGRTYRVTQGYDGEFSHHGGNRFAIDWALPEGTAVHAARGGLVVKVKDDSNRGGGNVSFDKYNNYVLIRHSDGTLGQYCHLKKGGMTVREGDIVNDGDVIARSGNTGFSSGPHLHFSVYKMRNGKERESIPVKFKISDGTAATLKAGRRYTAPRPAAIAAQPDRQQPTADTGG